MDENFMATIMFKTGADAPYREGMYRLSSTIFSMFTKNNINSGWIHGSVVIFEVKKYCA